MPWVNNKLPENYAYIQSLPSDNPHLDQSYLDGLEELKIHSPELYKKKVQGSWDANDEVQQLMSWQKIYEAEKEIELPKESDMVTRALGIDVGRFGPDPSVWEVLEGSFKTGFNTIATFEKAKTSIPEVVSFTKKVIQDFAIPHRSCQMDTVGLGGGAFDYLVKDGYYIKSFSGGGKSVKTSLNKGYTFNNLNSQSAWCAKYCLDENLVGNLTNKKLQEDLAVYNYDIQGNKQIVVESKSEIKKRIGRSPDNGDAWKMAVWGLLQKDIRAVGGFI